MKIGSICSGYEGLGMAVHAALGGELAWVADNDPDASRLLAHRFPDVPNLGDVTQADWGSLAAVDVLAAGTPCQDVSQAGARAGLRHGTRSGLWHEAVKAVAALRPSLVVVENVLGLLTARGDEPTAEHLAAEAVRDAAARLLERAENLEAVARARRDAVRVRKCRALAARAKRVHKRAAVRCQWHEQRLVRAIGTVLGSLAALGYDAEWTVVTAAAAGACHRRARVFVLAFPGAGRAVPGVPVAVVRDGEWFEPCESLFGAAAFAGRLPASGSMAGGRVYEVPDGVISSVAAGLLKTPTAQLAVNGGSQHPDKRKAGGHGPTLADQVEWELLPTPTARVKGGRNARHGDPAHGEDLPEAVMYLPTPNATDWKGSGATAGRERDGRLRTPGDADLPEAVALLPTPRATDGTKGGPNQRGSSGDLMLPSAVMELLPTPQATDGNGGPRTVPGERTHRGTDHGPRLRDVAPALLPTPSVADGTGGHKTRSGDRKGEPLLGGIAMLLPTPAAGNFNDGESLESWEARRQANLAKGINGNGQGTPLAVAARQAGTDWGPYEAAIRRWEAVTGRPAPRPTMPGKTGERLNPALPEWMMGLPAGWITDVPGLSRNAQLKIAGNGVVPRQGVLALRLLLARAGLAELEGAA